MFHMFPTIQNGWEYAKLSYGILWEKKSLLLFPVFSTLAAALVLASFYLPLASTGTLEQWEQAAGQGGGEGSQALGYAVLFAFYFANYFVIVFFNAALVRCALDVLAGRETSVGRGLSAAMARLPQIFGWALLSAAVGVLLRALERNEKVGALVSALLGTAWTVMTYFAVPVIVVEGVGPFEAFKRSTKTLTTTWGTALVGNFSLGLAGFFYLAPLILGGLVLGFLGFQAGATGAGLPFVAGAVLCFVAALAASSAADVVFKAVLYQYSTGHELPADLRREDFSQAFARRR